jgi:ribosomal protein S18 acetylase RimI-like enzyme
MVDPGIATASRFSPDPWLAESLQRPVFRLSWAAVDPPARTLRAEMASLSGGGEAFFYAKLPTSDVQACNALGDAGFALVDTAITLARTGCTENTGEEIAVGIARGEQYPMIPGIAEKCFRWSRFHLDPKIPAELANAIKRRWLESYVHGTRGCALYAAEIEGQVAGFLAVAESAVENRRVAIIDLLGVAAEHQGKGVGSALVRAFTKDWQGRVAELRVGTQAANIPSLRLYENHGFRIVESSYVLHAHYHGGEIQR